MKRIILILSAVFAFSPAFAAIEGDLDNNGAIDVGFGGTNAKTAGAARSALGLGNVNNTSDANKPASTAVQALLDAKAPLSGTVTEWVAERTYNIDDFATYEGKLYKCALANTSAAGNAPGVGAEWTEFVSGTGGGSTNLSATAGSTTVTVASDTGNDATLSSASTIAAGVMTAADKTKLDGIATGATANSADATLLNRANHTGTQAASTISDFSATVNTVLATPLSKLSGIATGAEVNVNADWNASSGDAQILNKPTIFSVDTDQTITGEKTFEDIILPKFDTVEMNVQTPEPACAAGEYKIYFFGTKARQCINGTASDIGSGGSMTYPGAGIPNSTGSAWGTSYTLDTDLASTSSNDDSIPSAKAVRAALDGFSASSVPSVTATPADAATGAVWYNSTANEFCVAESAGISCVAMTYTADDNDPSNSTPWFTDETDITLSANKISNAITLAGLGARGAAISVTGSTGAGYSKNSAACTSSAGRGYNDDTVAACVTASSSNNTATTATVTIGTDSDTYSVTTVEASAVSVTDNFNRSNGSLGSNWTATDTTGAFSDGTPVIDSNVIVGPGYGIVASAYYSGATFNGNQYASAETLTDPNDGTPSRGPAVRLSAGPDGYYGSCYKYGGYHTRCQLYRIDDGALTQIGSNWEETDTTANLVPNKVVRVEANGSTIKLFLNGTQRISTTDTTYSSGYPGIRVESGTTTQNMDNFAAGDL